MTDSLTHEVHDIEAGGWVPATATEAAYVGRYAPDAVRPRTIASLTTVARQAVDIADVARFDLTSVTERPDGALIVAWDRVAQGPVTWSGVPVDVDPDALTDRLIADLRVIANA